MTEVGFSPESSMSSAPLDRAQENLEPTLAIASPSEVKRKVTAKSCFASTSIVGGKILQEKFLVVSQSVEKMTKFLDPVFKEMARPFYSNAKDLKARLHLTGKETHEKISKIMHSSMLSGQTYSTVATFCNFFAGCIGFAAGVYLGLKLSAIGGAAGALAGAIGGGVVGAVTGYLAGEQFANYVLEGINIDPKEHKNVQFFLHILCGGVGALAGFSACMAAGTIVGGFLGFALTVGGLGKLGAFIGWSLSAMTIGGLLDAQGKAYRELALDLSKKEGFTYTGPSLQPTILHRIAMAYEELKMEETKSANMGPSSSEQAPKYENMYKMLRPCDVQKSGAKCLPQEHVRGGKVIKEKASMVQSVCKSLIFCASARQEHLQKAAVKKAMTKEESQEKWHDWFGVYKRLDDMDKGDTKAIQGSKGIYYAGQFTCALAISLRVLTGLIGVGVGVVCGTLLLAKATFLASLEGMVTGAIEGSIGGALLGYLLAEWLNLETTRDILDVINKEYIETHPDVDPLTFKDLPDFQEFKKEKLQKHFQDGRFLTGSYSLVMISAVIACSIAGGVVGLLGGILDNHFIENCAIIGGSVKMGLLLVDYVFGHALSNIAQIGNALSASGASKEQLTISLSQLHSPSKGVLGLNVEDIVTNPVG
jgi:hypothetical protein